VPAGSGAKFRSQQGSDHHTVVFWTRGDRAMFVQDGKTMQCELMATQVNQ
jgi:membrane-bound inhibitor of C-type lysozyme